MAVCQNLRSSFHNKTAAIMLSERRSSAGAAPEQPGAAQEQRRSSQEQPGAARSNQEQPGAARSNQEQPGAARSSQEHPGAARSSQEQPGAARAARRTRKQNFVYGSQLYGCIRAWSDGLIRHSRRSSRHSRRFPQITHPRCLKDEFPL